jgi:hypothetical protein
MAASRTDCPICARALRSSEGEDASNKAGKCAESKKSSPCRRSRNPGSTRERVASLHNYASKPGAENARTCRDEVCQITVSGRRARSEDERVRAARQGIVDARGVGPSGGYRSRYVVESLGNPHAYPNRYGAIMAGPAWFTGPHPNG